MTARMHLSHMSRTRNQLSAVTGGPQVAFHVFLVDERTELGKYCERAQRVEQDATQQNSGQIVT